MKARARKLLPLSFILTLILITVLIAPSTEAAQISWKEPDRPDGVNEGEYLLVDTSPENENGEEEEAVVLWHMNHAIFSDHKAIEAFWYSENNYTKEEAIHKAVKRAEEYNENNWGSMNIYDDEGEKLSSAESLVDSIYNKIKEFILSIPETIVDTFTDVFEYMESLVYDIEDWILNNFDDGKYGQAVAMPIAMTAVMAGLFLLVYGIIWIIGAIPVL